jgi:hypothetical protein
MAQLIPIPDDVPIELDVAAPLRVNTEDGEHPLFIVAAEQRRWVLYDLCGATHVDARRVEGGATTLQDGSLICAGGRRLRLRAPIDTDAGSEKLLCGFCRDRVDAERVCCTACSRSHHPACLDFAKRCGRCGAAQ